MLGEEMDRRRAENTSRRKRVEQMTQDEKVRALLTDELTGLGNRRAWEEGSRRPVQAMLDVEGLKWVNGPSSREPSTGSAGASARPGSR